MAFLNIVITAKLLSAKHEAARHMGEKEWVNVLDKRYQQ